MTSENLEKEPSNPQKGSPSWNWTTKLVVGLALVALAIWLLVQFQSYLGPILLAFIIAYLFYPVANLLQKYINIPWRIAVTLMYFVVILALVGLLTWGGLALFEQIRNLITFIQDNIDEIPSLITEFTQNNYAIGPFEFTLEGLNWNEIANQIVSTIQPIVGQVGSIAGSLAAGAANIILVLGLVLLISYFLLAETEGIPDRFLNINIPGYSADLQRMGYELSRIWNAFIRGQIIVVLITVIVYTTFLGSMGLEFFFGLALLAALGRFVHTIFNLPSGIYALIVLGCAMMIDTMFDNLLVPKVMSEKLKVHPALVLVGALIAVNLLGIVGIILAAPVMATLKLIFGYILNKLADQDPWEELDAPEAVEKAKWVKFIEKQWSKLLSWLGKVWQKVKAWIQRTWCKLKERKGNKKKEKRDS